MAHNLEDPEVEEFDRRLRQGFFARLFGGGRPPSTSPADEPEMELERMLHGPGPVRRFVRRHPRKLSVAAGVAAILWLGTHGSAWMIERAGKSDTSCSNSDYEDVPGASASCAGRARLWLLVPRISPLHWRDARAADLEILHNVQKRALTRATEVTLDPDAQSAAVLALAELARRDGWKADRRTTDLVFSLAASSGSRSVTAAHGELAAGGFDRCRAMEAAIGAGDLARAEALARIDDADTNAYEYHRRRGALLCMIGAEEEGRAALERARACYKMHISGDYVEAQMALLACGAPPGSQRQETYREAVLLADLLNGGSHLRLDAMLDPDEDFDVRVRDNQTPFVAAWLLERERPIEDVVDIIAGIEPMSAVPFTPWDVGSPTIKGLIMSSIPLPMDPERHERAAALIDQRAQSVEDGSLKVKPVEEGSPRGFSRRERAATARRHALPLLYAISQRLWFEAAIARAGQFDRSGAMRDIDRAFARSEPVEAHALAVAAFAAWAGDEARATRALERALMSEDPQLRLLAGVNLALLHMRAGRFEDAHAAAARAQGEIAASKARGAKGLLAEEVSKLYVRSVGWVLLAANVRLGRKDAAIQLSAPTIYERDAMDWSTLAFADDDVRRDARFRMYDMSFEAAEMLALPATLSVMAFVARDGKSPGVWLSHEMSLFTPKLNGVTGMRARAEAARWRGDGAAAARWDGLAETLEKQFATPKRALLARLAGLD